MLSILLPSYNNRCLNLIKSLQQQASSIDGLEYEIIVADDGGTDMAVKTYNDTINTLSHCRYIQRAENVGRACIRNFLASESLGDYLLFLDSDIDIDSDDFIRKYITVIQSNYVIDGGVTVVGDTKEMRSNLRFWYEYKSQSKHTAEARNKIPYQHIHTANLLVPRDIFMKIRFDERFKRYGYEDVLFGKQLKVEGFPILHINNPVCLDKFESNLSFIHKTEEALNTLHHFRNELAGYSILLNTYDRISRLHLQWIVRLFHSIFSHIEKQNLTSRHPSLTIFKLYKIGYYCQK